MRLTFLGTSHGVPEPGRKCSSLMIQIQNNRYIIDMGCDAISELVTRNVPVESVKGIFISHPHGDHLNGLASFTDLINWYFKKADPTIFLPDEAGIELLKRWCEYMTGEPLREINLQTVKTGTFFDDGVLKVTAIPTEHCRNSVAFLLEAEGKRILYTGDLNSKASDFPRETAEDGLDFLIGEAAHFSVMNYVDLLKDKPVRQAVITHHYAPRSKDFLDAQKTLAPLPFTLAYDGMEFEI